jgi:hypothetical protein
MHAFQYPVRSDVKSLLFALAFILGLLMNLPKLRCAFALSLAASLIGADVAFAQELSLLEGFGDGFLFHWVFASGRKPNIDGSITYWQEDNAGAVTMRQSLGEPCVFHVNVLNLRPTRGNATLIETIYDLRDISFELVPKHAQAPAGGSFFHMKGPRVICEVRTGGDRDGVKQSVECKNEIESPVEPQMLPILNETAPRLRAQCRWK